MMTSNDTDWRKLDEKPPSYEYETIEDEDFPCILPSSPNWYCNNILDCLNGYAVFGGKNGVFMFNMKTKPPVCDWCINGAAFSSRITSVALMNIAEETECSVDHIAFTSDDGLLKIVDLKEKRIIKDLKKHMVKVTALGWSALRKDVLVSGDEKGMILIWNFVEKKCNIWAPLKSTLTCLVLSSRSSDVGLFGYINGNIVMGDTKKCSIIHTFKNNANEIYSLSWNPFPNGHEMFISTSKDKSIRIFDCIDQKNTKTFYLPRNIHPLNKNKNTLQNKTFFTALWLNETQMVSSYPSGELLSWEIGSGKWKVVNNGHTRIVFSMCMDALTNQFVTVSMDRLIIFHDAETLKPSFQVPTFGGFVYSISSTPHNPHCLALGVGDNTIRVWDTSRKDKPYSNTNIRQGIKTKVTIIECHPNREGIIAYGTEDGHVGCYSSITQKSDLSASYHKKTVYALSWGPCCCFEENEGSSGRINCLYSIGGEGSILMHKLGGFNQNAADVGKLIKESNNLSQVPLRSEIKWHSSFDYVAIGNEDGSVDLLRSLRLVLVIKVQVHKKMINTLAWHHHFGTDSLSYSFWLACGSNEDGISVIDANMLCEEEKEEENESLSPVVVIDNPSYRLNGHNGRITKLAWSPHTNGILASASYDGSVQVWDVKCNEGLGNYRGHLGRVHCVAWSYTNPDVLFSGGEDFCLHRWKYSKTENKVPPPLKKSKGKSKKKKKEKLSNDNEEVTEETITTEVENEIEIPKALEASGNEGAPSSFEQQIDKEMQLPQPTSTSPLHAEIVFVERGENEKMKGRLTKASLFKKSSLADSCKKEQGQQDCVNLAMFLSGKNSGEESPDIIPGSEEYVNFGLYAGRKDVFRMLSTECNGHIEDGKFEKFYQLQIWQNNIPSAIDHAIQNKMLNQALVSLSPLGGYDLWVSACLAYGEQLEESKQFQTAASYYVSVGEARRAITMFRSHNMLKEAIVLAKIHLSKDDPLVNELYEQWAKKLSNESSYEHSAKCFLASGHIEEAITMLCKRKDGNAYLTALKVTSIYGMRDKIDEFTQKAAKCLFQEQRWKPCFDLLKNNEKMPKILSIQLVVGELFTTYLNSKDLLSSFLSSTTNHINNLWCSDLFQSETTNHHTQNFITSVLKVLEEYFTISDPVGINEAPYVQIQQSNRSSNEVLYDVINMLVRGIVGLLNKDLLSAFKELLLCFEMLSSHGYQEILCPFYLLLFPSSNHTFDGMCTSYANPFYPDLKTLHSNFLLYKYQGLLYTTWWELSKTPEKEDKVLGEETKEDENKNTMIHVAAKNNYLFQKHNVVSLIYHCSSLLLSTPCLDVYRLKERLNVVDEKIMEFDIKKRLQKHLVSKRAAVSNENDDDIKETELMLMQKERGLLIESLQKMPSFFKDFSIPNPRDSINVLLLLCCIVNTDGSMNNFIHQIQYWCKDNSIEPTSRFVEYTVERNLRLKDVET